MNRYAMKAAALLLLLMSGTACTSLSSITSSLKSPGLPSHPWLGQDPPCKQDTCTPAEAATALARAQNYCMELREFYQRGGQVTGSQRLFFGVLGSLAGSVFSATATGSAAKAWAGLSGATNGIQTQIDLSTTKQGGPHVVEAVAKAQQSITDELKPMFESKKWDGVVHAAILAPDRCGAAAGLGLVKQALAAELAASAAEAAVAKAEQAASAAQTAASKATTEAAVATAASVAASANAAAKPNPKK